MLLNKIWGFYRPQDRLLSFALIVFIVLVLLQWMISGVFGYFSDAKGIYTEGVVGDLTYINPLLTEFNPVNRDVSRLLYSGLVRYNPDKKLFEPDLATFTINDEVTEYTFKLKKDLKWHDGETIDADDIVFTFDTIIKSPNFPNALLQGVFADVQLEKLDDLTVVFRLSKPNSFFLSNMITGIIPQHIFELVPAESIGLEIIPELVVGSGSYQFDKINLLPNGTQELILEYNKDYHYGKPKIKELKFLIFPNNETLITDQAEVSTIAHMPEGTDAEFDQSKFKFSEYQLPQYTALFLNQESSILRTERMRKILKNAFDKNYLATELKDKQAIGGPYFFLETIDNIPARDLNPLKKELDENGWELNSRTGYREDESGNQLRLILLVRTFDDLMKQAENAFVVQHIREAGEELGIRIDLVEATAGDFAAKLANKSYDIVLYGQDFAYNLDAYSFWHSSQVGPNTFNLSNFSSVSADDALEKVRNTRDQKEQLALLEQLNIILKAEAPAIFLYTQKYRFAFDNSVKNRTILDDYATVADRFYNVHEWKL